MDDANGLTIECSPNGRKGNATLTARLGAVVVAVETLDLTKPKQRQAFALTRFATPHAARHPSRGG